MTKAFFTLDQANAMVPELQLRFETILQLRRHLHGSYEKLEEFGLTPEDGEEGEGWEEPMSDEALFTLATLKGLVESLKDEVRDLKSLGIVVSDLEACRVEWPAIVNGREVLLCWRIGSRSVTGWLDPSFVEEGLRPLSDLYVEIS